jgi:ubiquinone/menaquinone biosynthesis C-methylase UbiE
MNRHLKRVKDEISLHFKDYAEFLNEGDSVVDIGIGAGFTAQYIKVNVKRVNIQGIDIYNSLQTPVKLTLYDGQKIPFPNKCFDVSLLFYTLHHSENPPLLLSEAARITKRCIIVIESIGKESVQDIQKDTEVMLALGLPPESHHHHNLTQYKLLKYFKKFGLNIVKTKKLYTKSTKSTSKHLYVLQLEK